MRQALSLSSLLVDGLVCEIRGDANLSINGIKHDSRRVEPGDLFVALPGEHRDGMNFVIDAFERGAVAILSERAFEAPLPVLISHNPLLALSRIATSLYGDPSAHLDVVGVTGTNGKTTTCYLVEAMLESAGARPAVVGTVNFRGPQGVRPATHTTPMADDLMRTIRDAVEAGATHLVLEVSSHALAMHRADGVHFKVAAFTNLTQDHLDFHGDLATYEKAKRRLFEALSPKLKVVNIDDPFGSRLARELSGELLLCSKSADAEAHIRALEWHSGRDGIGAIVTTPIGKIEVKSPLVGDHNLENLLVALGCAVALEIDRDKVASAISRAKGAPGRLERIDHPAGVLVLVDYAHTPDALARVLAVLRPLTEGRLLVVFGCGGDRDTGKRPLMGEVGARGADIVILTSDNPRSEPPETIIRQIEQGVLRERMPPVDASCLVDCRRGYLVREDRRSAIDLAIAAARPKDSVLIAGKGHETVQIVGANRNPFDDRIEARRAIDALFANR
ncbi:MAG: UDP-N-acetylmuramoyl-L-alanyl-D-glutamate--2,6-diaminopimelate ligase [Deltaproteobacteria bacterium]|nr:UDP-N-acetylmuramoyl-L-alanyl-D-glutamate--2,6-diaminopimelate ligase [Deltaproteobacteria bacterium]